MKKNLLTLILVGIGSIGMANTNPFKVDLKSYGFVSPFASTKTLAEDYCAATAPSVEAITSVIIGEINNPSPASGVPGYEDFTALAPANLAAGDEYEIKLKGNTAGNFTNTFTVFIDFNQNKEFEESERFNIGFIKNSSGVDDIELVGSIAIPQDALPGETRMRILKRYTGTTNITYATSGCVLGSSYGQVEDYTVKIGEPIGCLSAPNGLYPSAVFRLPSNNGIQYSITNTGWTGEYSNVRVKEGYTYNFATGEDTHFITIADEAGLNIITAGTGSVTWTANATQIVRFYLHLDDECNYQNSGSHKRLVSSMAPKQTDAALCNPAVESNNFENGSIIGGANGQRVAINFDANPSQIIKANKITLSLLGDTSEISFDVYSSNADGLPDQLLKSVNGTITNKESTGTHFNFPTFTYSVDFSEPIEINGDEASRYWIEIKANVNGIETSSVTPNPVNLAWNSTTANTWRFSNASGVYSLETECSYVEPDGDACDQEAPSNNFENGMFLGGTGNQRLAIDIPVGPDQKLTATHVELNLFNQPTHVNFSLYADASNLPGTLMKDVAGTIVSSTQIGTAFNYPIYKVVVKFDAPIVLDGSEGTKYWLETKSDALALESTSATTVGSRMAFMNSSTSGAWVLGSDEGVYKLIAFCDGEGPGGGDDENGDYCIPQNIICDDGDVLTNVTFGAINNPTACGGGYSDFTAMSTDVERGGTYPFTANTGTGWTQESVHVWIDYNQDGVFTADEYTYIGNTPGVPVTNNITIPATAQEGATRMRVRVFAMPGPDHPQASVDYANNGACYDDSMYPYGEIEDYTVNIGGLGVDNISKVSANVYPNPVHDVLTIESKSNLESVEIFNIAGQKVHSLMKVNKAKTEINVSRLTPGVYIVRTVDVNGNVNSYKVVKK
ncbi:T9SS type A sorting domain-containing protein [Vaginella massiliensis]|uniref:T9SS type A sorting domain-containing protein n=1 Tax=Vaginella massiliensis TaxID=1816680 RepID=UPI000837E4C4|nr:T9SS type A sorting domain-containing protein [Vaginella massiliensis]